MYSDDSTHDATGSDVVCIYRVTTKLPIQRAAAAIAAEQSTGTWTEISARTDEIDSRYGGRVLSTKSAGKWEYDVTIEFPFDDFDAKVGGVPQLLSIVAGNLFGLEDLKAVRLNEIFLPRELVLSFPGPKFGADGIYSKLMREPSRPLLGTIVKPKIGLDPKFTAEYVYRVGIGGLTNSKDDETLVDQAFCPILERTRMIAEAIDRVKSETGQRMMHAINVSTRPDKILQLADRVISAGASELMVDVMTCGFPAVQILAEDLSINLPIHVHRTMHAAITRTPNHGISMPVISLLSRICGGDALHIGTFGIGKMHGGKQEDLNSKDMLSRELFGRNDVLPVCSGGVHPALLPKILRIAGTKIQIQAGGGVSGHPEGLVAGAKAMNQAVDAFIKRRSLKRFAENHHELRLALEKWG